MADIDLKTLTPDTSLPTTGFLFGADSQGSGSPSVYSTQTVATTLLGSTSLTGDTLTADAPVLNLAQTWNNAAITFTGIKYNATSTASAAASLLMDLQVGAVSKFKVDKAGNAYVGNPAAGFSNTGIMAMGAVFGTGTGNPVLLAGEQAVFYASNAKVGEYIFGTRLKNNSAFTYEWSSTSTVAGATDLTLSRKAAANLQLGAADAATPVAQTLSVQSIVGGVSTDASAAAYPFTITGAQGTGTGAGGSIVFQVAPAGGSGTAQNALAAALTIASTKNATFAGSIIATSGYVTTQELYASLQVFVGSGLNAIGFTNPSANNVLIDSYTAGLFGRVMFGGTTSSFPALKRSTTSLQARLADDSAFTNIQGKLTTDTAYTAGALVATGYITIYDSTGTAYRVPCLV